MKTHTLTLPDWGPYHKIYAGVSHVADKTRGIRFDLDLFPGFYRRSIMIPKAVADCGAHAWRASTDGSHFCYRYELERKNRVYLDADFLMDDHVCQGVLSFVNKTELPQSVQADLCFSLRYPTFQHRELITHQVKTDAPWYYAHDYAALETDQENACDGLRKSETLGQDFTGQRGIDCREIAWLRWTVAPDAGTGFGIRYQADEDVTLRINRGGEKRAITLPKCKTLTYFAVPWESSGEEFLIYPEHAPVILDGFCFSDREASFPVVSKERVPQIRQLDHGIQLCYPTLNQAYTVCWDTDQAILRELYCDDAGRILSNKIHDHVSRVFSDGTEGHFTDLFLRPIFLEPGETKKVTVTITAGEQRPLPAGSDCFSFPCNPEGKPYLFSQNLEAAVSMLNVVYPVYCKKAWIKHYCPGREWDSLYTWDSGMIGVGLTAVSAQRAEECLRAYLVEPDDPDCAFIMHGSPVATQIFLFAELWQKTGREELIKQYYPSLKKYYQFYSGKKKKAPKTGLLQSWDQFYNSGGWDDYPPQKYVHEKKLEWSVTPVITTAMTILFAKIMLLFAPEEDRDLFLEDIRYFSRALEAAWDEESGYYGYVCHNKDGEKEDILRTPAGENYNCGLDGLYPYLADAVPPERKERMLSHLRSQLMTKYGISVVDTTASYFRTDGYWNGSVWMPHQWIVTKALLDQGQQEFAWEIAKTGLSVWKSEADETFNCYEHFMLANGRGAGFHQFSGLSAPVMKWFASYYVPGTVTCGFQSRLEKQEWDDTKTKVSIRIKSLVPGAQLIVCLTERDKPYHMLGKGRMDQVTNSAYCITLEGCEGNFTIL